MLGSGCADRHQLRVQNLLHHALTTALQLARQLRVRVRERELLGCKVGRDKGRQPRPDEIDCTPCFRRARHLAAQRVR
eukprot:2125242-Rhodomonas_salina.2